MLSSPSFSARTDTLADPAWVGPVRLPSPVLLCLRLVHGTRKLMLLSHAHFLCFMMPCNVVLGWVGRVSRCLGFLAGWLPVPVGAGALRRRFRPRWVSCGGVRCFCGATSSLVSAVFAVVLIVSRFFPALFSLFPALFSAADSTDQPLSAVPASSSSGSHLLSSLSLATTQIEYSTGACCTGSRWRRRRGKRRRRRSGVPPCVSWPH